jgi:hypothetical protein
VNWVDGAASVPSRVVSTPTSGLDNAIKYAASKPQQAGPGFTVKGIFMQALFSNGRWTYAIALAATVVGLLNTSKVVHAADSSMCIFVKKVLATREAEFSPLKGKEDTGLGRDKTRFHGTLAPEQGVTCKLYVRRQVGKRILSPEYVCTLIDNITYD